MEIKEEWKQIRDLNYEASVHGEIRNIKTSRIIKQRISTGGYLIVDIQINKKNKTFKTHRLIAETFLGVGPNGKEVDHINRVKTDNRVENLRWVTRFENMNNIDWTKRGLITINEIEKIINLSLGGKNFDEIYNIINNK